MAKSFRNIEGVSGRPARRAAGVADVIGATSLVVTEAAPRGAQRGGPPEWTRAR